MDADPSTVPSLDVLFDSLAHSRRRQVLAATARRPGPVDLETLAAVVSANEGTRSGTDGSRESTREVRTSLHHVHVPKLSAAGLLEVDEDARTVERTALPPGVDRLISAAVGPARGVVAE